uniref:Uncharacterized protein n=1 Tax=Ananas comosus var. bracteatus TaxID=296719 RepID=A0A6V7QLW0_ANACO|nr:unnamed protein product [Ananas comosus var. bracteatus]
MPLSADAIADLAEIAGRIIRAGYGQEMSQMYIAVRRDAIAKTLATLDVNKMSIEDGSMPLRSPSEFYSMAREMRASKECNFLRCKKWCNGVRRKKEEEEEEKEKLCNLGRNGAKLREMVQFWAKFVPFLLLLLPSSFFPSTSCVTWVSSTTTSPARSAFGCPS